MLFHQEKCKKHGFTSLAIMEFHKSAHQCLIFGPSFSSFPRERIAIPFP